MGVGEDVYWKTPLDALIWASILGVAWGIVVAVSPWQTSRYLMARSEHVVLRSACGALIAMLLLYLVTNFAATTVNLIKPDITPADSTMIWVAMNLLPPILGSILICGVLAAGLSSGSTFLSLVGFSVSYDILQSTSQVGDDLDPCDEPKAPNLTAARVAMLVVGLSVIGLALLLPRNIYWLTHFAGPLFASSWGVVAFMSIWSARLTESGAFWGMVVGFTVNVGMNALSLAELAQWPVIADPILVGVASSYLVAEVVSRASHVSGAEADYRNQLHQMLASERDPKAIRQTLLWTRVMMVMGGAMAALLVWFYALPYREARRAAEGVGSSGG